MQTGVLSVPAPRASASSLIFPNGKRAASLTAVFISSLVLLYGGSGLRDASGKQVRLDRNCLLRQQVDFCVESLKSGKGDFDPMLPGADEHPMPRAAEFTDSSGESIVHKNSGSLRCDLQLDLRCDFWKLRPRIFQHDDLQDDSFVWFHNHLLPEIRIPGLAHGNFMFTGQKQDLVVILQLIDVADVLSIDPDSGCLIRLGLSDQLHFTQDLALSVGRERDNQSGQSKAESCFAHYVIHFHLQPPGKLSVESRIAWERFALPRIGCPSYSNHNCEHPLRVLATPLRTP